MAGEVVRRGSSRGRNWHHSQQQQQQQQPRKPKPKPTQRAKQTIEALGNNKQEELEEGWWLEVVVVRLVGGAVTQEALERKALERKERRERSRERRQVRVVRS